jgi:methylenetetrahydrofolate dehydrogenase (NADP+)/methenyltetrahydrofolate cyclohydrolase
MTIKLDGALVAREAMRDLKRRVTRLAARGVTPGLVAIRVGDDASSELYVERKMMASAEIGITSRAVILPVAAGLADLVEVIERENRNPATSGILVQLPLPAGIETQTVIEAIAPAKDVDGFHPFNVGRVATGVGGFAPCTPLGVLRLLDHYGIDVRGREAVVVGASRIVGRPVADLFISRMATVTVCHIETRDLAAHTRRAEILVVAAGRPNLVGREMVGRNAILVDVGINRVPDASVPRGFRVQGDIAPAAREGAFAWTPVPGGVGPMTVAMLMENTVLAAEALSEGRTV